MAVKDIVSPLIDKISGDQYSRQELNLIVTAAMNEIVEYLSARYSQFKWVRTLPSGAIGADDTPVTSFLEEGIAAVGTTISFLPSYEKFFYYEQGVMSRSHSITDDLDRWYEKQHKHKLQNIENYLSRVRSYIRNYDTDTGYSPYTGRIILNPKRHSSLYVTANGIFCNAVLGNYTKMNISGPYSDMKQLVDDEILWQCSFLEQKIEDLRKDLHLRLDES